MPTSQFPLEELLHLGPGSFHILAGREGLKRQVGWVNAIAGGLSAEYMPAATELVLLIPPYADAAILVERLLGCGSAGVALVESKLPQSLLKRADKLEFPIIALPGAPELIQLQRNLLRFLLDSENGVLAWKSEIYERLTRMSTENQGIEAIGRAFAEMTRKGVLIQDKRLQILAAFPPPEEMQSWQEILAWSASAENLPPALVDRKRAASLEEAIQQPLLGGAARLVVPIIVHEIARGFLSIVSPSSQFDRLDRIALEQGAAACALEMAKAKAVSEARKQLTGDLIEAVLASSVSAVDAARWADRAGYRRTGPHVAMTLEWASPDAPTLRRLETIVSGEVKRIPSRAVAQPREEEIVIFYALHAERGFPEAQQWAQKVYDLSSSEFRHSHLALGIGRPSEDLLGLRHSYREAALAMALERKLHHVRPQYFGDLGVYRLLLQLEGSPELRAFSREILGSLIEYDKAQGTNLVDTLSVYFQHNANLAQAAQALYVHRNTLLYRLQRASEIGKFDLDNAETRLGIQLALRAYELSRDESDFLPPL